MTLHLPHWRFDQGKLPDLESSLDRAPAAPHRRNDRYISDGTLPGFVMFATAGTTQWRSSGASAMIAKEPEPETGVPSYPLSPAVNTAGFPAYHMNHSIKTFKNKHLNMIRLN
jgi:hypothetical protein